MYVNARNDLQKGMRVTVAGKIARVDGSCIYISVNNQEIPVRSANVSNYVSGAVAVTGFVDEQRVVVEESLECIEGEFDTRLYTDFVDASKKLSELF